MEEKKPAPSADLCEQFVFVCFIMLPPKKTPQTQLIEYPGLSYMPLLSAMVLEEDARITEEICLLFPLY